MRNSLFILFALIFSFSLFAQHPTTSPDWVSKTFHHEKAQIPYRIIEYEDGFLLPLNIGSPNSLHYSSDTNARPCLLRLDENLNTIDSFFVNEIPGAHTVLNRVFYRNQNIYLMVSDWFEMYSSQFRWIILDRNFNQIGGRTQTLDSIYITEYATEINVNYVAFLIAKSFSKSLIMEMSYNGDSVRFRAIDQSDTALFPSPGFISYPHNLVYLPGINSYLLSSRSHPAFYLNYATGETDSLGTTWGHQSSNIFSNPTRSGNFLYTGFIRSQIDPGLAMISRVRLNGALDTVVEIPPYHNARFMRGGVRQTMSVNQQNEVYTFHLENFWAGDSSQHDIIVSKFDDSLSLIWQKPFDVQKVRGYANSTTITPMGILATSNGGCLISFVAPVLRADDFYQPKLFLLKLDANGSALSQTELKIPQAGMKVFPNPGREYFEISLENAPRNKNLKLTMYNAQGQPVKTETFEGDNHRVKTNTLASGIYFFEVSNEKGQSISRGKWVKE